MQNITGVCRAVISEIRGAVVGACNWQPLHLFNTCAICNTHLIIHQFTRTCAGLFVLQPDVLLSGTRVAGSFRCARQAVLEERLGGSSGAKAVEGTLLHELFQVSAVAMLQHSHCNILSRMRRIFSSTPFDQLQSFKSAQ
jgi:hypothetical protein